MRITVLLIALLFAAPMANAQHFALNKKTVNACIAQLKGGKDLFKRIGNTCAIPLFERECRAGGKNAKTYWVTCPPAISQQMERWIKVANKAVQKRGGKYNKERERLMQYVGDGTLVCKSATSEGGTSSATGTDYCRAILLTQTYGMLRFLETAR